VVRETFTTTAGGPNLDKLDVDGSMYRSMEHSSTDQ
jgi:hypothetical protein